MGCKIRVVILYQVLSENKRLKSLIQQGKKRVIPLFSPIEKWSYKVLWKDSTKRCIPFQVLSKNKVREYDRAADLVYPFIQPIEQ